MEVRPLSMLTVIQDAYLFNISSEGVQVGGIRSTFGVLGAWTTVHHDRHDPVGMSLNCNWQAAYSVLDGSCALGPLWLRKVPLTD